MRVDLRMLTLLSFTFDRSIIKWLLVRRRLVAPSLAARLVQQWFRGVCFSRLALELFAPFVGSTITSPGQNFIMFRFKCSYLNEIRVFLHRNWFQCHLVRSGNLKESTPVKKYESYLEIW